MGDSNLQFTREQLTWTVRSRSRARETFHH